MRYIQVKIWSGQLHNAKYHNHWKLMCYGVQKFQQDAANTKKWLHKWR